MNSATIQRYARVSLYFLFGMLANYGLTIPDATKSLIASVVGAAATLLWTVYGTKLSGLLTEIKNKSGVDGVVVQVDPNIIDPSKLSLATPPAVGVKTS